MPVAVTWLIDNLHWLSPLGALIYSEALGWKSGGQASISQKLWAFIKQVLAIVTKPKE